MESISHRDTSPWEVACLFDLTSPAIFFCHDEGLHAACALTVGLLNPDGSEGSSITLPQHISGDISVTDRLSS